MEHYMDNGSLEEHVGSPTSHDDVMSNDGVGLDNHGKGCEGMINVFLWYVQVFLPRQFMTISFSPKAKVALLH